MRGERLFTTLVSRIEHGLAHRFDWSGGRHAVHVVTSGEQGWDPGRPLAPLLIICCGDTVGMEPMRLSEAG